MKDPNEERRELIKLNLEIDDRLNELQHKIADSDTVSKDWKNAWELPIDGMFERLEAMRLELGWRRSKGRGT